MKTIVVTRHQGLVDYLIEKGIIDGTTAIIAHATPEDVSGNHVIGVLPSHLACLARAVTEIPLALAAEDRGKDLPVERVREIAGEPRTYQTREVLRWGTERPKIGEKFAAFLRVNGLVR